MSKSKLFGACSQEELKKALLDVRITQERNKSPTLLCIPANLGTFPDEKTSSINFLQMLGIPHFTINALLGLLEDNIEDVTNLINSLEEVQVWIEEIEIFPTDHPKPEEEGISLTYLPKPGEHQKVLQLLKKEKWYQLILKSARNRYLIIKYLEETHHYPLIEATKATEDLPKVLFQSSQLSNLIEIREELSKLGATVEIWETQKPKRIQ
jgi:ribosomal protein L7/L12